MQQALPYIDTDTENNSVIVLYGDVPLISADTLQQLIALANAKSVSILTLHTENPTGLGRIIRDESNSIIAIVEDKDASVDFNLVMTEDLELVELQGSGEENVFTRNQMDEMLDLAEKGVSELVTLQKQAILDADQTSLSDLNNLADSFKRL